MKTFIQLGYSNERMFDKYGFSFLSSADCETFNSQIGPFLISVWDNSIQVDIARCIKSRTYAYYSSYFLNETPHPAKYLQLRIPNKTLSIIAQSRLNKNVMYFEKTLFEYNGVCQICNSEQEDGFTHFFMECIPMKTFDQLRNVLKQKNLNWYNYVNTDDIKRICKFYNATSASLRLRKFILKM